MAETLFLVWKAEAPGVSHVNDISSVLINCDDADTDAVVIANAVAQCVAGGHAVPDDYFSDVLDLGDLTTGALKDDNDAYVFGGRRAPEKVEG
jgi:hypothetical protein